jgi:hypothetical protein
MEEIRLLLLVASILILIGLLEILNLKIESYDILALNSSVISIILAIFLILLSVYIIWKKWKPIEIQKEILEEGSREALKAVSEKIENLKLLLSKPTKKNLSALKKEVRELKLYRASLTKLLGENSKEFFEILDEIERTNSLNKIKRLNTRLKKILE